MQSAWPTKNVIGIRGLRRREVDRRYCPPDASSSAAAVGPLGHEGVTATEVVCDEVIVAVVASVRGLVYGGGEMSQKVNYNAMTFPCLGKRDTFNGSNLETRVNKVMPKSRERNKICQKRSHHLTFMRQNVSYCGTQDQNRLYCLTR